MRFKKANKQTLLSIITCISIIPILFLLFYWGGVIFTYTGSVPIGFYKIVPMQKLSRGDHISFCLPLNIAKVGIERGYIERGKCSGGAKPLLKEVIGVPGDNIRVSDDEIVVNGVSYKAPTDQRDHNGLKVTRFVKNGYYKATPYYWVYGYGNIKYSWDSRYYGGIPKENIIHRLKPLLTF